MREAVIDGPALASARTRRSFERQRAPSIATCGLSFRDLADIRLPDNQGESRDFAKRR
ncbi:hypothetical protein [Burkholderia oklahomensis]|uniref:hypothetical protein n=1 Tax=Burkholderia oklahomensis TaxID=342113 RepID=UPI00265805A4|nr:hypothetical protein [Burkholderia oklahomensis]